MRATLLIKKYEAYNAAFWGEIATSLKGPLNKYINEIMPDYYRRSGNLLIFPATDGLVGIHFERDFKFAESKFNSWLSPSPEFSPFATIISCSHSDVFTIAQWAQVFSGNMLKLKARGGKIPENISVSNFPQFPSLVIENPVTRQKEVMSFLTLEAEIDNIGISLRDIKLESMDSSEVIKPFLWSQIDIYSQNAIESLTPELGKLNASREILAIVAGGNLGMNKSSIGSSPPKSVAVELKKLNAKFREILSQSPDESELQVFLRQNPVMLFPDYVRLLPQPMLGAEYKMDFLFVRPASTGEYCIMVEIESPKHSIFTQSGDTTAAVNHAFKQVRDWRAWLSTNSTYAQSSLKIETLNSHSKALIVIGRSNHFTTEQIQLFRSMALERADTEFLTYDDLAVKMDALIANLESTKTY